MGEAKRSTRSRRCSFGGDGTCRARPSATGQSCYARNWPTWVFPALTGNDETATRASLCLKCRHRHRFVRTTESKHALPIASTGAVI
jgi:hypothetical protein